MVRNGENWMFRILPWNVCIFYSVVVGKWYYECECSYEESFPSRSLSSIILLPLLTTLFVSLQVMAGLFSPVSRFHSFSDSSTTPNRIPSSHGQPSPNSLGVSVAPSSAPWKNSLFRTRTPRPSCITSEKRSRTCVYSSTEWIVCGSILSPKTS